MKKITIIAPLLLAILIACEQKPKAPISTESPEKIIEKPQKITVSPQQTLDSLKNIVGNSWMKKNPVLEPAKPSFFTNSNENSYSVFPLQIGEHGMPFVWDSNFALAESLLALDNNINIKKGAEADKVYKGTKITWNKAMHGLIWLDNKTYKTAITEWYLIGDTDCPGTISFPTLSFQKVDKIKEEDSFTTQGLVILPYMENSKIKSREAEVKEANGKAVRGIGYDINDDDILDIFSYTETADEISSYVRLYININGQWKCKWAFLDEECI